MNTKLCFYARLFTGLLGLSLIACQPQNKEVQQKIPDQKKDEVILHPDSPKHAYIKEMVATLVQRPLMDPVTGKITYDETLTARVSSPIAGRVIGSISALGSLVQKGDTLAELDSPELGGAQSDYAGATADLNLAKHAFERMQELYSNGITPLKELEQTEDNLTRAQSEAERARLKLVNLGARGKRMDNHFTLRAPVTGIVTERNINPGMEIRSDLIAPLFVITDLNQLWVQMDIFEKDIGLIHVGALVHLRVSAYPKEYFTATISYISQVVDEVSRTVKVRCTLPNHDSRLLPAMFATIEVQSDLNDLVIVVPLTALFTEDNSDWLYVNTGDYHYHKRPVKTGLRLKGRAVILEGLQPGENLVTDGALLLRTEQDAEQKSDKETL